MKLPRIFAIALSAAIMAGCDTSSNPIASNDSPSQPAATLPSGARILTVSGHIKDSTGNVRVSLRHKTVKPDASGNYTLVDTIVPFAARQAMDTGSTASVPTDTARIIVITPSHTDTLREVPLTSWSNILTPLSVVANDVSVNAATGSKISGKVVEAVWWADDTIAHVLRVPNSTSSDYFSTTIYTLYNDSAYAINGHKYFIFLRAKTAASDTLPLAATSVRDIGAQNGALNYTDTFFHVVAPDSLPGQVRVPGDSNVVKYNIKHAIIPGDSVVLNLTQDPTQPSIFNDSTVRTLTNFTKLTVSFDVDSIGLVNLAASGAKTDSFSISTGAGSSMGSGVYATGVLHVGHNILTKQKDFATAEYCATSPLPAAACASLMNPNFVSGSTRISITTKLSTTTIPWKNVRAVYSK